MITPFSHPKYVDNAQRCAEDTGLEPCCICGRPVYRPVGYLRVVDGGARFAHHDEVCDEDGDMGYYPIGAGCYRKGRKDLAPLIVKEPRP